MNSVSRKTPTHVGWLLPAGTLFFMCGIMLSRIISAPLPVLIPLFLSLFGAMLSRGWRRTFALMMAALSIGTLLGWHAYHPALPAEGDYIVEGTIIQEVVLREDGQVQTVLSSVTLDGQSTPDAHWTFYLGEDELPPEWLIPGTRVSLAAQVYHPSGQENPDGFDFRDYLLQRGIHLGVYGVNGLAPAQASFSLRGWFASLRHDLTLRLMDVMAPEPGAYAAAMLLGTRDFIPEDDRAAFNELGIAHILSVSGFHVGVLIGLLLLLLRPLPLSRVSRLIVEALVLAFYCLLTGGNAPVIRAAGLLLWREFTRMRRQQILPLHMLCVTALAQLLFNPTLLTSASFQLTYCAMLGLLLVYPRLKGRLVCRTLWGQRLWKAFAASVSALLGILLPQLYWFGELPLLAVVLNLAVIPLAGGLMTLYWLTLAALPIPGLNALFGTLSTWGTTALLTILRALAALDFTSLWTRQADALTFAGWVMVLFSLSALVPRRLDKHRRTLLLTGVLLVAFILIPLPENNITYTQFSVGNADAAILQDHDMTVVIDVGEDGQSLASYLHQQRQSVEALIITHLHTDHAGGIRALLDEGIPVEVCYLPADAEVPIIDVETLPLIEALRQTGTVFRYLHRGDVIPLPSGQLTVLWPQEDIVSPLHDANDVCLVLQADVAGVTMLLTSDLTGAYGKYACVPADILKIAHHGSKSANSAEFLEGMNPQILLQSNTLESREVHVAQLAGDIPLYSTAQHGGVTIHFLGSGKYEVETVLYP